MGTLCGNFNCSLRTISIFHTALAQENGVPYWYNTDTGEASFRTPKIIAEQEKFATALERGYNAMPSKIMINILSYLHPLPDRLRSSFSTNN